MVAYQALVIWLIADQCVVMLSQDSFYRNLSEEELQDVKSEPAHHISGG